MPPPGSSGARPIVLTVAAVVLVAAAAAALIASRQHATGAIEPDFHTVAEPPVPPENESAPPPVVRPPPQVAADTPADPARARELAMLRAMAQGAAAPSGEAVAAPPPPAAPAESPPPAEPPPPAPAEPTAASLPDVHVVVYTTSWCPVCRRAKSWMAANGVAYEERDVESSEVNARRMRAINPRGGVPTFDVEGQVMVGFSEDSLLATMRQAARHRSGQRSL
jgi:glutaredoxin